MCMDHSKPTKTGERPGPARSLPKSLARSLARRDTLGNIAAAAFLPALIVVSALITPNFLSTGTLETTLVQVFSVMLVALGMTLVISSGGIDVSVGAIMAISGAVSARLYTSGTGLVTSVGCGIIAAGLCGVFNGVLISKFRIQPIIVTLVVMIAGRGLAMRIQGQLAVSLEYTAFGNLGLYKVMDKIPIQIVIMLVAIMIMLLIVNKTVFAKHVEAMGDNCRAARLVGINALTTTIGVYGLCGVLCAIAGNMEAARIGTVNVAKLGLFVELDAIAAVAIGGTPFSGGRARIMGTVVGAIVVGLVTVIVGMNNIPSHYSMVFKALIVVVAMWAQKRN